MNVLASAVVYEGLHHIAKVHVAIDVGVRVIAIGNEYMEAKWLSAEPSPIADALISSS